MLLPAWGMALLPLAAGYYLVSVLLVLLSVRLLRAANLPWICIAAGLLSFPSMWTVYLGQFGLICGALLVYGLAVVETRPERAGAAMGLLAIKPQYVLLGPVVVLAARRWRAMVAGVAMLALMLGASWVIGGTACWRAYLGPGRAAMQVLLEQRFPGGYEDMGSSVFWMLRSLNFTVSVSYLGQAVASAGCAVLSWRLWRTKAKNRLAATVFLSLLPTPLFLSGALLLAWQNRRCPEEKTPAPAPQLAERPQHPAAGPEPA
jgi:alpha-1,2-mannosyltransferase